MIYKDMRNLNSRGEIQPVNAEGGQEGQNEQIIYGNQGITILYIWWMIETRPLKIMQC